jgi:putative SOS response-associated peptidase YedK
MDALVCHYDRSVCGRYTHLFTWKQLHRLLDLSHWPDVELTPRYNVAPTQAAPVVRLNERGERDGVMLRWGLIPSWAEDVSIASRLVNARGETAFDKPAFRKAMVERRCLVPISGFYEWQVIEGERFKRPHWIGRADREPLFLAGVWEQWKDRSRPESSLVETFTILTTSPNALMMRLHDRMPVILNPEGRNIWLDPASPRSALEPLIRPESTNELIAYPVGRGVNSTARDDASLLEPVSLPPSSPGLFQES